MRTENTAEDFVRSVGNTFGCIREGVEQAKNSIFGIPCFSHFDLYNILGVNFEEVTTDVQGLCGELKECYKNASRLAASDPDSYIYCEGYACTAKLGIPLEHAWVLDANGIVVDPTWNKPDKEDFGISYFGIPFSFNFTFKCMLESKHYGIMPNLMRCRKLLKTHWKNVLNKKYHGLHTKIQAG